MTTRLQKDAILVAERLRAELKPSTILLFGSIARGSDTERSDLDLSLIFDEMPGRKLEVMRKARNISRPVHKGAVDIVAYSREEWEAYIAAGSSFELMLKREAVAL